MKISYLTFCSTYDTGVKVLSMKINYLASSIERQLRSHLWESNMGELPEVTWLEMMWPEVTTVTRPEASLTGSMLCACATGSSAISAIVGPFYRKWRQSC